ncbi:outer membrane beta-barrel protein [Dankookia rubra]|uniref:outer membrane beta-barrel protein n=1 Tax=Dankookia rubra TaxID=1442381 RepID=UPI00140DD315|nr:outer membrane beta-barrel protein [Dankookia rubra]
MLIAARPNVIVAVCPPPPPHGSKPVVGFGGCMVSRIPAWVAGAVFLGALPLSDAAAQADSGISRQDVERGVTVTSRQRRDYNPLGVRLGAFTLTGQIDGGPGYDSNLEGTKTNKKSDGFMDEAAAASLDSNWTRHGVGVSGNMDSRQYFNNSGYDWIDWDVGGYGRYDFNSVTNAEARYRHYRDHLDVNSIDVQSAGITRPVPYDSDEFQATGTTQFGRIGLVGTGLHRTYRYQDVVIGGVPNRISQNDFDTTIGALGTSYAFSQGRFANVIFRIQDISYQNQISQGRNSFTWEVLGGFTYDFDGVWQGRVAFGWRERSYKDPNLKNFAGPAIEGQLTWAPTLLTTVRFNVARTIEESIRADAVSFNRTQGGIGVDHELLRNVILSGDFRADYREYQSPNQTAFDGIFTATARYLVNRNLTVIGTYAYSRRFEASNGIPEFDRNLFQVRLRVAL